MDVREQVAHLYRRFGLGASYPEVEAAAARGYEGAVHRLIEAPETSEFAPNPYEFVWYDHVDPDCAAEYFRRWWMLRMLCSRDPFAERMTLFWHSHFAVSGEKVLFGPMMLDYLLAIQTHGAGRFRDLLGAVVKTPALMEYLDMDRSLKGHPNENFPRELMELYTLGIGKYSEEDVRAAARCFTGWGYLNTFFSLPGSSNREKILDALRYDRPFAGFAPMPAMHDDGEKQFLGQKGKFTAEDLLDNLAKHPNTADRLVAKMWTYFAYADPEPEVLAPIVAAYMASDGDIRRTLAAIALSPAFVSERCVRQKMKDPADYTIGVMRAAGIGPILLSLREEPGTYEHPLPQRMHIYLVQILSAMDRQGMRLLFPPDPSGWKQGSVWASSSAMVARQTLTLPYATPDHGNQQVLLAIRDFVAGAKPKNGAQVVASLAAYFDWNLKPETSKLLADVWKGSVSDTLHDLWQFYARFQKTMLYAAAAPENHFC